MNAKSMIIWLYEWHPWKCIYLEYEYDRWYAFRSAYYEGMQRVWMMCLKNYVFGVWVWMTCSDNAPSAIFYFDVKSETILGHWYDVGQVLNVEWSQKMTCYIIILLFAFPRHNNVEKYRSDVIFLSAITLDLNKLAKLCWEDENFEVRSWNCSKNVCIIWSLMGRMCCYIIMH